MALDSPVTLQQGRFDPRHRRLDHPPAQEVVRLKCLSLPTDLARDARAGLAPAVHAVK